MVVHRLGSRRKAYGISAVTYFDKIWFLCRSSKLQSREMEKWPWTGHSPGLATVFVHPALTSAVVVTCELYMTIRVTIAAYRGKHGC